MNSIVWAVSLDRQGKGRGKGRGEGIMSDLLDQKLTMTESGGTAG